MMKPRARQRRSETFFPAGAFIVLPARELPRGLGVSVPKSRGAILTRESEKALWQKFFTAALAQRSEFEPNSERRKRVRHPRPPVWPEPDNRRQMEVSDGDRRCSC